MRVVTSSVTKKWYMNNPCGIHARESMANMRNSPAARPRLEGWDNGAKPTIRMNLLRNWALESPFISNSSGLSAACCLSSPCFRSPYIRFIRKVRNPVRAASFLPSQSGTWTRTEINVSIGLTREIVT